MRFGSVASGIEAASVAWHPLGWEAAWLAEVDVPASAVLAHRLGATAPVFPLDPDEEGLGDKERKARVSAIKSAGKIAWRDRVTNWGDMTRLPELIRSGEAEAPDLLCGGCPCQSFSIAGLRGGLADRRGNLTLAFVKIANAIDEVRDERGEQPCVVFYENVPGILTDKGNAFGHFLAGLAGESVPIEPPRGKWSNAGVVVGPQRTVAWRVVDAQYVGLAQRRARVFVVASAMAGFDPGLVLFEFDGLRRDTAPSREKGQDFTHDLAPCLTGSGKGFRNTGDIRGQDPVVAVAGLPDGAEPGVIVMAHGQGGAEITFDSSPTLTCNHEAPIAAYTHSFDVKSGLVPNGKATLTETVSPLLASSYKDMQLAVIHGTQHPIILDDLAFPVQRNSGQENVICFNPMQITNPHNGSNPQPGDPCHTLTGYTEGPAIFAAEVCPTLRAGGNDTGGDRPPGTDVDTVMSNVVMPNMTVRRLIPIETERLQGFEDDWTLVPIGNRMAADGPRYKQLGNSWAVPVVRWIGQRIRAELRRIDAEELI